MSDGREGVGQPGGLGIPGISDAVQIGRGGFGVVYRARQERFGRDVAVKVLHGIDLSDKTRRRFDRERLALGSVSGHPNIVTLYDAGLTEHDVPYLVMELLTGGTLQQRLSVTGPFALDQVFELGIKLAGALETAHRAGVLHLDVKPENVLLSGFGEPHLADFGIARFAGHGTRSAMVTASIGHAAPEILSEDDPTPAADVYSLASMLYALAAGKAPHAGESDRMLSAMITRILTAPAEPILGVPDALNDVLLRSLEKEPSARHRSVLELGQALHDAARGLGIAALPVPVAHATSDDGSASVPPKPAVTIHIDPSQRAAPLPQPGTGIGSDAQSARRRTLKVAALATSAVVVLGAAAFALTNNGPNTPVTQTAGPGTSASGAGAPNRPANGVTGDAIKIGWMGDLTGSTAGSQVPFEAGIRAYFDHANEEGGVAGRTLDLISMDDEGDQEKGALNYARLIDEVMVLAVVGQGGLPIIMDLSPQIEADGVPFIGPQQTADVQLANPYIWSTLAHFGDQADVVVKAMVDDIGGSASDLVVVSVGLEASSASEWVAYIRDTVEKVGGTYSQHLSLPLTGGDADAAVATIESLVESESVNYIALHASPGGTLRLLRSMDAAGLELPIGGSRAVLAENVFNDGPPGLVDELWAVHTYTPSTIRSSGNGQLNAFVDSRPEYEQFRSSVNFVGGWTVAKLAVEGIRRAAATGTLTRDTLNQAMGTIDAFDTGGQSPIFDCTRKDRACGAAVRPYYWDGSQIVARGDYGDWVDALDFSYGLGG